MNPSERKTLIAQYGRGFKDLLAALDDFPKEMWQFRPAPSEWSIQEIIIHLADSETNSYLRARRLVSDPGEAIMGYDQDKWAITLDYHSQDAQSALQVLGGVRQMTHDLIKDLPDEVWSHSVVHPEYDQPYTFTMWLEIYAAHIPGHIEQMQNNYVVWKETSNT